MCGKMRFERVLLGRIAKVEKSQRRSDTRGALFPVCIAPSCQVAGVGIRLDMTRKAGEAISTENPSKMQMIPTV